MLYDLSICIPTYKNAENITGLIRAIFSHFANQSIEIILVNDGSPDNTDIVIESEISKFPNLKYLSLRRNYGEYNAVMCALKHSNGKYVAIVDDDFQNPPESIEKLYLKALEGYDVVFADYQTKKCSRFRILLSSLHNKFSGLIIDKPKHIRLSTFKILKNEIVSELIKYNGPFPNLEAMTLKLTNNCTTCIVEHNERKFGKSAYNLSKLFDLWLNLILLSSTSISKITIKIGIAFLFASIILLTSSIIMNAHLFAQLSFFLSVLFSGFLLISGIILEYLGKIYHTQIGSPQFVIKIKIF
jgi:undecaprenyl-phosphate 4-deoxy-4-formamido-L-arabinose transferase